HNERPQEPDAFRDDRGFILPAFINHADEAVVVYFAKYIKNPVIIDPLLPAVLINVVNLGAHELGQRSHLFDAVIVVVIGGSRNRWAIGSFSAGEMTRIEKQSKVRMVYFALKTQHVLARARETAMVL